MKLKTFYFFAIVTLWSAPSFSQTSPLIKYLPDNGSSVMSFNPIKIANNIPGETFRQSFMYREMMKKDDGKLKAFMSDPSISGIDFSYDLMLVMMGDTTGNLSGQSIHLFGVLKNEAVFSVAVKKLSKSGDSLHEYGTNKILFITKGKNTLAWNNEIFVLNIGLAGNMNNDMTRVYNDTIPNQDYEKIMTKMLAQASRKQREECFYLLTPRPSNAIAVNKVFTSLVSIPGDIKIWNNGTPNPMMGKINPMAGILS